MSQGCCLQQGTPELKQSPQSMFSGLLCIKLKKKNGNTHLYTFQHRRVHSSIFWTVINFPLSCFWPLSLFYPVLFIWATTCFWINYAAKMVIQKICFVTHSISFKLIVPSPILRLVGFDEDCNLAISVPLSFLCIFVEICLYFTRCLDNLKKSIKRLQIINSIVFFDLWNCELRYYCRNKERTLSKRGIQL